MAGTASRVWRARADWIAVVVLVAVAAIAMAPRLGASVHWAPDALFYRAQVYELQGDSRDKALRRSFSSPEAAGVARDQLRKEPGVHRVDDPSWVDYSSDFYRRRWTVPAMAAALDPVAGKRSLLDVSMLGYVAVGLLLFALLRRRFGPGLSLAVAAVCLLLPPLRTFSGRPLTDSWGVALEIAALLAAALALERGGWRWVAAFAAAMLALSLTRDATVVVLAAVALVALVARERRSATLLIAGALASVPAPWIFKVPLVDEMSYTLNDFRPAHPASWSFVAHHWPSGIWSVVKNDLAYPTELSLTPIAFLVAAVIVAAFVWMLARAPWRDPFFTLQRGAVIGSILTIAVAVNYTSLRIELVLLPAVAVGLAFAAERLLSARARARPDRHELARTPA